ncbi:MAG: UDP-N-acetylglucosamine--N-acetylmuramyl-(pentapeptide) pyrophosphoryl-undecaprenol N-acetylglucosamine transferase [Patescibacteria group bacterium]
MRILFTGGGTGGHIYPILAVAEELQILASQKNINLDLRYFGAYGSYQYLLASNGILVSKIISAKWRRYFDLKNFLDIPKFFLSFIQAMWKIFWFMPDVLFSKGGPGSLPVVMASRFYRIPVMIHDSDAVIGLANKIAARYASRIGISFESAAGIFGQKPKLLKKVALVGNPVRRSLLLGSILEQGTAKRVFGFDQTKKLVMILGGSQGSAKLNEFFFSIALELMKDYQILHQVGVGNFEEMKKELNLLLKNYSEEEKSAYKIAPYFDKDLKDAYCAADLVISRASSGAIFEISAFGKPAILIPLPEEIVGPHQILNAYEYAKTGAATIIEESNLKAGIFINQLNKIFNDQLLFKSMSESAKKFFKPDAAKIISEEIIRLGSKG